MIELHLGDCLEILSAMPEMSVDAIVTDPPYGLSFMGKKWDYDVPDEAVWRECLRVLKPGGHLLCFAGTRTQHRMAVRIEDAGFEIRDMIAWVYGCLDDRTEVATSEGVKPHHKTKVGDTVLCYNPDNGEYSYQPILEIVEYDYSDTAFRISGDFGEQVVTRNHRCIIERDGKEVFVLAEQAARQQQVRVPLLESLPELRQAVSDAQQGASEAQQDVLCGLCEGDNQQVQCRDEAVESAQGQNCILRGMRNTDMEAIRMASESENANMQQGMQRQAARTGLGEPCSQGQSELETGIRGGVEGKNDGRNQSIMEGRANVSQPQGCLCKPADQVRALPAGDGEHGSQGWVCDGTPLECGDGNGATIDAIRVCPPHQPRCDRQPAGELDAIQDERRTQGVRAWRGHKTALVRIEPFHYTGKVWCLRVPTGAFVAVRNGVAFPTGNSGFPKSLNVSKAINKAAGAEREVVGTRRQRANNTVTSNAPMNASAGEIELITAPATPEAQQWDGWGTALKPAMEMITVARKPLIGTVAENVLRYGTGAINVDRCSVAHGDDVDLGLMQNCQTQQNGHTVTLNNPGFSTTTYKPAGRFPANFIHDGSEEVVGLFPQTTSGNLTGQPRVENKIYGSAASTIGTPRYYNGDSGSAARFFYCAKASKADRDEGCEKLQERSAGECVDRVEGSAGMESPRAGAGRTSGSRNFHPTVKPTDLMRYLCRLITPPGGIVLDPFMGSGSTGKAAMLEGFNFIGIEREPEYMEIAKARIHAAIPTDNATVYEQLSLRYL